MSYNLYQRSNLSFSNIPIFLSFKHFRRTIIIIIIIIIEGAKNFWSGKLPRACNRASHNYRNRMAASREEERERWTVGRGKARARAREREREGGVLETRQIRRACAFRRIRAACWRRGGGGVRRDERWKYRVIDAGLISISVSADWLDGPVNQPIFHAYWSCPVQCCRHRRPPVSKNRTVSPVNLCPICAPPLSTPLLPALFSGIIREIKLTDIYMHDFGLYSFILNFEYG